MTGQRVDWEAWLRRELERQPLGTNTIDYIVERLSASAYTRLDKPRERAFIVRFNWLGDHSLEPDVEFLSGAIRRQLERDAIDRDFSYSVAVGGPPA
jgi:hypothetical protein